LMLWHVRANANVKGRPNMKASDFQKWVNTELIPNHMPELRGFRNRGSVEVAAEETPKSPWAIPRATWKISLRTAKRWLFELGFRKTKHRKTMYIDGHERADVVLDRKRYVEELATYTPYMCIYCGDDMDIVTPPDKIDKAEVVLVVHDETVLHQHDGEDWSYQEEGGSSSLNQKSMGAGYHVSGFLSEKVGRLTMTKLQWDAYLSSLDAAGQLRAMLASEFHQAHKPDVGHLDANVSMFIGKTRATQATCIRRATGRVTTCTSSSTTPPPCSKSSTRAARAFFSLIIPPATPRWQMTRCSRRA